MPRRIAVLNQKGGVGKSTTTVNVAVALAQRGLRVLVVDLDAQRNATQFLGLADYQGWGTADFVLAPEQPFSPQRDVLLPGLDLIPATEETALVERRLLDNVINGPKRLKRAIEQVDNSYNYILTDLRADPRDAGNQRRCRVSGSPRAHRVGARSRNGGRHAPSLPSRRPN